MIVYFNGDFLREREVRISPNDRGFLFADGIYEVIRSYNARLFNAQSHVGRLKNGAKALNFNAFDFDYLIEISEKLIQRNNLTNEDAVVYIQVTRGAVPRSHYFPPQGTPLTVFASASSFTPNTEEIQNGINIILSPDQRWARCDIKSINLLPNTLAHQQARESNAVEAVFCRDGFIMEGTHSNFFAVLDGSIVTPPKTNYILGGITREVVLDLCKEISVPFKERPIAVSEVNQAEELMIVGTTVEITPAVRIDGEKIGSGMPGPITRRLQQAFRKVVSDIPPNF